MAARALAVKGIISLRLYLRQKGQIAKHECDDE